MFAISAVGRRSIPSLASKSQLKYSASAFRTLLTTPSRPSPTATTPNARPASTVTHHLSHDESTTHLNKQRLARPNSPHMTIYQPQITWYGSIANRITGVGLSVGLYVGLIAYVFNPILPFLDGAHLIDLVASFPTWLKTSFKMIAAVPFSYHSWNGLRHLAWDVGYLLSVKAVTQSGWAVVGLTAVSSIWLCTL